MPLCGCTRCPLFCSPNTVYCLLWPDTATRRCVPWWGGRTCCLGAITLDNWTKLRFDRVARDDSRLLQPSFRSSRKLEILIGVDRLLLRSSSKSRGRYRHNRDTLSNRFAVFERGDYQFLVKARPGKNLQSCSCQAEAYPTNRKRYTQTTRSPSHKRQILGNISLAGLQGSRWHAWPRDCESTWLQAWTESPQTFWHTTRRLIMFDKFVLAGYGKARTNLKPISSSKPWQAPGGQTST